MTLFALLASEKYSTVQMIVP